VAAEGSEVDADEAAARAAARQLGRRRRGGGATWPWRPGAAGGAAARWRGRASGAAGRVGHWGPVCVGCLRWGWLFEWFALALAYLTFPLPWAAGSDSRQRSFKKKYFLFSFFEKKPFPLSRAARSGLRQKFFLKNSYFLFLFF